MPKKRLFIVCSLSVLATSPSIADQQVFGAQTPDARPVSFINSTTAVLNYATATAVPTRIQLREGSLPASTPGQEDAWKAARVIEGDPSDAMRHCLTLAGLKPATRYYYRCYDPEAKAEPPGAWSAETPWTREHAFATLAGPGETCFLRMPVKVLLVTNVFATGTLKPDTPVPEPMPEDEIELYKRDFRQTALFYWINSRMRYWVDCEFFVEPEWQRVGDEPAAEVPEFFRNKRAARDGLRVFDPADISNHGAKPPLKDTRIWAGQVIVICERHWDADKKRWFYQGSGGGTYGIDWMLWEDKTQVPAPGRSTFLGGSDQAWLLCHEFHHQKESQYAFSGLVSEHDRVPFNHFSPRYVTPFDRWEWDTAFNHGEHWDGIAWELRMLTDAQYFRNIFGEIAAAKDSDGDGIPDGDPRLPTDEKRLGGNPSQARTDGLMHDMDKLLTARWVPTPLTDLRDKKFNPGYLGMGQAAGGARATLRPDGYAFPDFLKSDSDGDGIPDKDDVYPIYPWEPVIRRASIKVDGELADWASVPPIGFVRYPGVVCTLRTAHDDDNLYYAVDITGTYSSVMFNIDADADGWYAGNDNLQIVVGQPAAGEKPAGSNGPARRRRPRRGEALDQTAPPELQQVIAHICGNRSWPYFDDGQPVRWTDEHAGKEQAGESEAQEHAGEDGRKADRPKREYAWQRPKMFGGPEDVRFGGSVKAETKRFEIGIPNGGGKMPIQAAPGHKIAWAVYIHFPEGGPLAIYEPYELFVTTWERAK